MDFGELVKSVLTTPKEFFKGLKKEQGVKNAFTYYAVLSLIYTFLGFVMNYFFQPLNYAIQSKIWGIPFQQPVIPIWMTLVFTVIGYGIGLGASFVGAAILHVWILIFGGKEEYSKTYQLSVYASTPILVLGWIPFVSFFAWIYNIFLLILGTREIHKISDAKSIWMYLIPIILLLILVVAILLILIPVFKTIPPLYQTMPQAYP